jgi:carbon-monoxide dehydrogenase medium subunit
VKPAPFRYADPRSVPEALEVLAAEEGAKVLAGGQSLLPLLSMRLAAPATLVDLNRVPGLDTVEVSGDGVRVRALVRHAGLLAHDGAARVQRCWPGRRRTSPTRRSGTGGRRSARSRTPTPRAS